jgi:hypothetical protein
MRRAMRLKLVFIGGILRLSIILLLGKKKGCENWCYSKSPHFLPSSEIFGSLYFFSDIHWQSYDLLIKEEAPGFMNIRVARSGYS